MAELAAPCVMLNALPTGVTSNPASPFSVAMGASTPVVFKRLCECSYRKFHDLRAGHEWRSISFGSLAVAIQSALNPALPRTAYARTDSTLASRRSFW